jgi:hypothetical protein
MGKGARMLEREKKEGKDRQVISREERLRFFVAFSRSSLFFFSSSSSSSFLEYFNQTKQLNAKSVIPPAGN